MRIVDPSYVLTTWYADAFATDRGLPRGHAGPFRRWRLLNVSQPVVGRRECQTWKSLWASPSSIAAADVSGRPRGGGAVPPRSSGPSERSTGRRTWLPTCGAVRQGCCAIAARLRWPATYARSAAGDAQRASRRGPAICGRTHLADRTRPRRLRDRRWNCDRGARAGHLAVVPLTQGEMVLAAPRAWLAGVLRPGGRAWLKRGR